jgi:hypothetical protein
VAALYGDGAAEFRRFPVAGGDALRGQGGEVVVACAVGVGAQVVVEVVEELAGRRVGPSAHALGEG